jgi:hypothetical protein
VKSVKRLADRRGGLIIKHMVVSFYRSFIPF